MTINSIASKGEFLQPTSISTSSSTKTVNSENTTTPALQPTKTEIIKPEQIQEAVDQIQLFMQTMARNLNFSIDEDTGKTVIKVMDGQTNEVIRQMPSEEAINIAHALGKIRGTLFDDKA